MDLFLHVTGLHSSFARLIRYDEHAFLQKKKAENYVRGPLEKSLRRFSEGIRKVELACENNNKLFP